MAGIAAGHLGDGVRRTHRYDPAAAKLAWQRTLGFFDDTLGAHGS